jgi:vitamin B12 transporter
VARRTLQTTALELFLLVATSALPLRGLAEEKPTEDEATVDVHGTRPHPTAISAEPGLSGSSLDRQQLAPAGVTLPDALRTVPGLTVTQLGGMGAPATARVRGASAAQTALYLGSIRLNDEVGGVADLSTIPTSLIGRVDIYRSLTPRFSAAEGMGGTIVIAPRTPRETELSSKLTFGSFTSERLELTLGACRNPASCVLTGVELTQARNDYPFRDSRGVLLVDNEGEIARLPNADSSQASAWLTGTTELGQTDVLLFLEHTAREQGAPKLALVPSEEARARFQRTAIGLELDVPLDALRGDATFTSTAVLAGTELDDPLLEMGLGTNAVQTPGSRFEQAAQLSQQPLSWLFVEEHLSISYEGLDRFEAVEGRTQIALSASRLGTRLALGAEVTPLGNVAASARLSLQCLDTSETSLDFCSQVLPGARGGLLVRHGALDTYFNVAQAARPPTLSELYGVSLLMRGNENLEAETATTLEGGVRHHLPAKGAPILWFDASAFARFARDLIVFTRTAQGYLRPENRDQTRTLGAELLVGAAPWGGFRVEGNVALLDPRDTTPSRATQNDILPFLSRLVASASAEQRVPVSSPSLRQLRLGLRTHYESSRYADSAGLAVVPEQSFTDLELGSSWFSRPHTENHGADAGELLSLEFRVSNVFDQVRYDIVGFPLPGRAWFLSLGLELP